MKKGYLVLENGQIFEGMRFGAFAEKAARKITSVSASWCLPPGVVGYIETLTDPSYYGQIVMQTFPQIGNYGVIPEEF